MKHTLIKLYERLEPFKWWVLGAVLLIFLSVNYILANFFIPNQLSLAVGDPEGEYARLGAQLKERLADKGIELSLSYSAGSLDNLSLLKEGRADAALLQSGLIEQPRAYPELTSVASVYHEPLFLFYRRSLPIQSLSDLRGRAVAVGQHGSGTWYEVERLLARHDLRPGDFSARHLSQKALTEQLQSGQLDAAFLVAGINSPRVDQLIRDPDLAVLPFEQYKSYQYYFPHLGKLLIPAGYYSLRDNIPAGDLPLITLMATVVAQQDLHNRLVEALLISLQEILAESRTNDMLPLFSAGSILFPSERFTELPLHPTAEVYFREGPSLLARYFSYHVLFFLSRIKFLLIPMLPALLLFIKVAPGAYRYRLTLMLKARYKELVAIESQWREAPEADAAELLQRLAELKAESDEELAKIPPQYQRDVYDWKMHLQLVQREIAAGRT